jgi:asparagine synthetase B (glutamine-hydrolysing)
MPKLASPPISLPQWVARLSSSPDLATPHFADGLATGLDGQGRVGRDVVRAGPLTITSASEGAAVAAFGSHANPGVVLMDGYLLDGAALRRDFGLRYDASDLDVASAAYARYGSKLFEHLDGSYLLAVWDPRDRRLLLGHDHLGHHPVYYAESDDGLAFSTNVLALARSGAVSGRPNRVSLAMAALQLWPAAGQTFFEDVHRLRGGHYLVASFDAGTSEPARAFRDARLRISEHQYWSPWLEDGEPGLSEREAHAQFEPALVSALARAMELRPQGIMLSGGLDSVTIAALAAEYAREHGTPIVCAMSGRRDMAESEEEPMQAAVVSALEMPHITARESEWTGGRSTVDMSLDVVRELPGPSRIYWVGAYMAFYRFTAAHGLDVLLTGSGGDNWVSVADAYAAHAMRTLQVRELIRHLRSWTGTGGLTLRAAARHLLWSGGLRLMLDSYGARLMPRLKQRYHRRRASSSLPPWLAPDRELREALVETLVSQRPASLLSDGRVPRNFYRHAQRSIVNPYFQYEFEVGFHVESTCGLRLLSPYHDRRMVKFLNSIPPSVLLHGDRYKGLLRPVAASRLPALGLESQRKTYAPGVIAAQHREFRSGIQQAWPRASVDRLRDLGVVHRKALRRTLTAGPSTTFDDLLTMYAVMSAEEWARERT